MTNLKTYNRAPGSSLLVALALLWTAGCDTGSLLEVNDPDLVTPENVTGPKGAELFWAGAVGEFGNAYSAAGGPGSTGSLVMHVGMFTDEFHLSGTFPTRFQIDRRDISLDNGRIEDQFLNLHQARAAAEKAVSLLEEHLPGDVRIAEMYNFAGYAYLFFGENFCSGVPYSNLSGGDIEYGEQQTTAETFQTALARFTSARSAAGSDADQEYLSRLGEARVLLNQGSFAEAAAAVTAVPTDWVYLVRHKAGGDSGQRNSVYELNQSQRRWSLSDGEGGGIAFRTADDPRVPWEYNDGIGFDEETPLYEQLKYPSWEDDVPLASGIEARLIEAEALLDGGDPDGMIGMLNGLRATIGLADLVDPGDLDGRVALLFEERAFWLFATAHRLGDMRRLVRQYGWTADAAFPSGAFHKGGNYGNDMNFPIPEQERENSNVPSDGPTCLDRNA